MLTYWFPDPVSFWWSLAFAIVFAVGAVVAVFATLARRAEERNAGAIATLYGVGLGLAAVSEFVMYLQYANIWSLATAFALSTVAMNTIMIVAAVVAVLALIAGVALQIREERGYRLAHPA